MPQLRRKIPALLSAILQSENRLLEMLDFSRAPSNHVPLLLNYFNSG